MCGRQDEMTKQNKTKKHTCIIVLDSEMFQVLPISIAVIITITNKNNFQMFMT